MIVPREDLGAIARGELDETVIQHTPPPAGSVQAVQGAVGKRATCRVEIIEHWPHMQGGHVVRFQLHVEEVAPRLLRSRGGYTNDPEYAMRDPDGKRSPAANTPPLEPESIDKATLERYAAENSVTFNGMAAVREAERRERWSIEDRLRRVRARAQLNGVDLTPELRVIERRLTNMERKIGMRAA